MKKRALPLIFTLVTACGAPVQSNAVIKSTAASSRPVSKEEKKKDQLDQLLDLAKKARKLRQEGKVAEAIKIERYVNHYLLIHENLIRVNLDANGNKWTPELKKIAEKLTAVRKVLAS